MTSPAVRAVVEQQLRRELAVRLTHGNDAILRRVPDLFRRIIGEALAAEQGDTGKAAQYRAAQRALDKAARIGVMEFRDSSGRRWAWQHYAEMAVRTAAMRARTSAQVEVYRARGIRLVAVSDHAGACKLCAPYEGQLLALDDMPDERVSEDRHGQHVKIVATLAEAHERGFQHPNCRHGLVPWIPGRSTAPEPQPYNPDEYEAQQHQRYLERQIRYWRRREDAAITDPAVRYARGKVREWQREAAHHARTHRDLGVRRIYRREQNERALTSPTPQHT